MKPIPLSEKQVSKLYEMIKTLFPEYTLILPNYNFDDLENTEFALVKSNPYEVTIHHWFEFCMTWLPVTMYRIAVNSQNEEVSENS